MREENSDGKVREAEGRGGPDGNPQRRYRRDHSQAVPEDDQARRARQGAVFRTALQRQWRRAAGLRAEPGTFPQGEDPGGRWQILLWVATRARASRGGRVL